MCRGWELLGKIVFARFLHCSYYFSISTLTEQSLVPTEDVDFTSCKWLESKYIIWNFSIRKICLCPMNSYFSLTTRLLQVDSCVLLTCFYPIVLWIILQDDLGSPHICPALALGSVASQRSTGYFNLENDIYKPKSWYVCWYWGIIASRSSWRTGLISTNVCTIY